MTTSEILPVIALIVTAINVIIAFRQTSFAGINRKLDWEVKQENRITQLETQLGRMQPVNDRVVALETKMGVFWNMIEHLSVSTLIHSSPQDIADATIYDSMRSRTPTPVLQRLGRYLADKLNDPTYSPDEKVMLVLKLGAIQAQLIDRGEEPIHYGI